MWQYVAADSIVVRVLLSHVNALHECGESVNEYVALGSTKTRVYS